MKTREQIDAEFARLERRLPELLGEVEPSEVLEAFACEAECILEAAPSEYVQHIHTRIGSMLESAGVLPISGRPEHP